MKLTEREAKELDRLTNAVFRAYDAMENLRPPGGYGQFVEESVSCRGLSSEQIKAVRWIVELMRGER